MGEVKPTNHHQKPLPSSSERQRSPGDARRHRWDKADLSGIAGTLGVHHVIQIALAPRDESHASTKHVEVMNRWKKLISHDLTKQNKESTWFKQEIWWVQQQNCAMHQTKATNWPTRTGDNLQK